MTDEAPPKESDFQEDIAAVQKIGAVPTILDVVCRTTGMGFAAIARVTENRWIACAVKDDIRFGLKAGGELKVETTICNEIRQHREAVIIDNVADDAAYCMHPTPAKYGFKSYISVPITLPNGEFFGTLCAIDPKPVLLNTPEVRGTFRLFAELIAFHLEAIDRMTASQKALLEELNNSEMRERFIAVLSHDLLTPLTAIGVRTSALMRRQLDEEGRAILDGINGSVRRMSALIRDLRDFTRGRFGGGLAVLRDGPGNLAPALNQVIEEARTLQPGRAIDAQFDFHQSIDCDRARMAQLLSNLLSNALTYGRSDGPVRVRGSTRNGIFELSVSNCGDPIPDADIARLFMPFSRGSGETDRHGLGLGLYIASEIARAHSGTLTAFSSVEETRFTCQIPIA